MSKQTEEVIKQSTEEFVNSVIELLSTLNTDATLALEGKWDRSDDGFIGQQTLISEFADKYSLEIKDNRC